MAWKPEYVSTSELRSFARIPDGDDDTEIDFAIAAASRAVDKHTHRQFGVVEEVEARLYTATWSRRRRRWVIEIDDLMTEDDLTINADLDDDKTHDDEIDDFHLEPVNNQQKGKPWERIVVRPDSAHQPNKTEHGVEITALWGWSEVPEAVKEATLLQGNRILVRRQAAFGVAGSPETGSEVRLLERVDPDVAVSLKDYIRWWGAV